MLEDLEDLFVEMLEDLEDLFVEMLEDQRDLVEWLEGEEAINLETKCMVEVDVEKIKYHHLNCMVVDEPLVKDHSYFKNLNLSYHMTFFISIQIKILKV